MEGIQRGVTGWRGERALKMMWVEETMMVAVIGGRSSVNAWRLDVMR